MSQASLNYLTRTQADDGSFEAWAGNSLEDFKPTQKQPTAFQTSLIVDALQSVPGTELIRERASAFIASQLLGWLDSLQKSADAAIAGRSEAEQFIVAYGANYGQ